MTLPSIGLGPTTSPYSEQLERAAWPEPDQPSKDVEAGKKVSILDVADLCGWKYRITYAVGCWPSTGGRPGRQRASYAYRFWRGRRRAVAVQVEPSALAGKTWTWDTLLTWDLESFPVGHSTLEAFATAMFGPVHRVEWPKDWSCSYFGPLHGPEKHKKGVA